MRKKIFFILLLIFVLNSCICLSATTVKLETTIFDAPVLESNPNTNYDGNANQVRDSPGNLNRFYIMMNVSSLPLNINILDAKICLTELLDFGTPNASVYHVTNKFWNETDITWNNQPCGTNFDNSSACNLTSYDFQDISTPTFVCWNVTGIVEIENSGDNSNISLAFKSEEAGSSGFVGFDIKEGTDVPYLNVTYSDGGNPTSENLSNNASDVTKIGGSVNYTITLNDAFDLDYYKFAHNMSGVMTNVTAVDISGTQYNVSYNFTVNLTRGNQICGQFWFNDTSGNINTSNLSCFIVANTIPIGGVSINSSLLEYDDNLQCNINYTDADSDTWASNKTRWYINGVYNSSFDNLTTINSGNTSYNQNWTCNGSVYDGYNWSSWVNDTKIIQDTTNPNINSISFSSTSFDSSTSMTVTVNCTDAGSNIDFVKMTLNTSGSLENKSFTQVGSSDLWTFAQTYGTGTYTTPYFYCQDAAGNLNTTTDSTMLTVTAAVVETGGGGGSSTVEYVFIGNSTIIGSILLDNLYYNIMKSPGRSANGNVELKNTGLVDKDVDIEIISNPFLALTVYNARGDFIKNESDKMRVTVQTVEGLISNVYYLPWVISIPGNASINSTWQAVVKVTDTQTFNSTGLYFNVTVTEPLLSKLFSYDNFLYDSIFDKVLCLNLDCSQTFSLSLIEWWHAITFLTIIIGGLIVWLVVRR